MGDESFEVLILIGRPAAGKSELIAYLKSVPEPERRRRFHLGAFEELDDFPMLWTWFEEDLLLEEMGKPRLHTDADGYFREPHLWDLLIKRLCLEYGKRLRDDPCCHERRTVLLEFSRGREHGGFKRAFSCLSEEILSRAAVLAIHVSWEESRRKNRRRFNPQKPDSILEHGLPEDKMERLYRESDWEEMSAADPEFLRVAGRRIPYAVLENEDDVTTAAGEALGQRLEEAISALWARYRRRI